MHNLRMDQTQCLVQLQVWVVVQEEKEIQTILLLLVKMVVQVGATGNMQVIAEVMVVELQDRVMLVAQELITGALVVAEQVDKGFQVVIVATAVMEAMEFLQALLVQLL